jgi:hypothetical protein
VPHGARRRIIAGAAALLPCRCSHVTSSLCAALAAAAGS